jgi:Ca2+-binding EF-hand superfamily protein
MSSARKKEEEPYAGKNMPFFVTESGYPGAAEEDTMTPGNADHLPPLRQAPQDCHRNGTHPLMDDASSFSASNDGSSSEDKPSFGDLPLSLRRGYDMRLPSRGADRVEVASTFLDGIMQATSSIKHVKALLPVMENYDIEMSRLSLKFDQMQSRYARAIETPDVCETEQEAKATQVFPKRRRMAATRISLMEQQVSIEKRSTKKFKRIAVSHQGARSVDLFGLYSKKEVNELAQMVCEMDVDFSGDISITEFEKFVNSNAGETFKDLSFDSIDMDHSGVIDVKEIASLTFPLANSSQLKHICDYIGKMVAKESDKVNIIVEIPEKKTPVDPETLEDMKKVFELFDVDKSGTLSVDEILLISKDSSSLAEVESIMLQYDGDKNNTLDVQEFTIMMLGCDENYMLTSSEN